MQQNFENCFEIDSPAMNIAVSDINRDYDVT
jgi:hypothetical protein